MQPSVLYIMFYRSIEEGGLWSLTLENYIQSNNLAENESATLKKLYNSPERLAVHMWYEMSS